MKKAIKGHPEPEGMKVKVTQANGRSVSSFMCPPDPFERKVCGRTGCPMAEEDEGCKSKCYIANVNYTYICKRCKKDAGREGDQENEEEGGRRREVAQYRGETSQSLFSRHKGHLETLKSQKESWMLDHAREEHPEVILEEGGAASLFGVKVEPRDNDAMRRILGKE